MSYYILNMNIILYCLNTVFLSYSCRTCSFYSRECWYGENSDTNFIILSFGMTCSFSLSLHTETLDQSLSWSLYMYGLLTKDLVRPSFQKYLLSCIFALFFYIPYAGWFCLPSKAIIFLSFQLPSSVTSCLSTTPFI